TAAPSPRPETVGRRSCRGGCRMGIRSSHGRDPGEDPRCQPHLTVLISANDPSRPCEGAGATIARSWPRLHFSKRLIQKHLGQATRRGERTEGWRPTVCSLVEPAWAVDKGGQACATDSRRNCRPGGNRLHCATAHTRNAPRQLSSDGLRTRW